jgi:hypothetical protein
MTRQDYQRIAKILYQHRVPKRDSVEYHHNWLNTVKAFAIMLQEDNPESFNRSTFFQHCGAISLEAAQFLDLVEERRK